MPAQVDKTPTPDPDIRRWPFWIKPAPRVIRTEAPKDSIPPFVKSEPRFISREEVALHNSSSSAFIILDNKVYLVVQKEVYVIKHLKLVMQVTLLKVR